MLIPSECTLAPADAHGQAGSWQQVLTSDDVDLRRESATRARVRLLDRTLAGQVADLAQREATCCRFFTFTLVLTADAAELVIDVTEDGVGVLDSFGAALGLHRGAD